MSRPLEVTDIYIQVRLHQESRPGYALDAALYDREMLRNPNALLKANQLQLESRASTAIDPDEAIRKYRRCIIVGDPGGGRPRIRVKIAHSDRFLHVSWASLRLFLVPDGIFCHLPLPFVTTQERTFQEGQGHESIFLFSGDHQRL